MTFHLDGMLVRQKDKSRYVLILARNVITIIRLANKFGGSKNVPSGAPDTFSGFGASRLPTDERD